MPPEMGGIQKLITTNTTLARGLERRALSPTMALRMYELPTSASAESCGAGAAYAGSMWRFAGTAPGQLLHQGSRDWGRSRMMCR
jgi:hypothetical protein